MNQSLNFSSQFLSNYLQVKSKNQGNISLRSFAKKLKLSPGGLSQILSGQKRLSVDRAYLISQNLELNDYDHKLFTLYCELDSAANYKQQDKIKKEIAAIKIQRNKFYLNEENHSIIEEWFHCAILECISTYGNQFSLKEIADHFLLEENEVTNSIDLLKDLGLIKYENNQYIRVKDSLGLNSNTPKIVFKNFYILTLDKIKKSIINNSPKVIQVAIQTFTFDSKQEETLKELTRKYLADLQSLSDLSTNKNNTYAANIFINKFTN